MLRKFLNQAAIAGESSTVDINNSVVILLGNERLQDCWMAIALICNVSKAK